MQIPRSIGPSGYNPNLTNIRFVSKNRLIHLFLPLLGLRSACLLLDWALALFKFQMNLNTHLTSSEFQQKRLNRRTWMTKCLSARMPLTHGRTKLCMTNERTLQIPEIPNQPYPVGNPINDSSLFPVSKQSLFADILNKFPNHLENRMSAIKIDSWV